MSLLNLPGAVLSGIGVDPPTPTLRLAMGVLLVQAAILSALIAHVLVLRLVKSVRAKSDVKRNEIVEGIVLGVLTAHMEAPGVPIDLPRLDRRDRERFRRTLLSHVVSITGAEQALLVDLYVFLGLIGDDLANLRSRFWWRRLEGVSALEALGRPEGVRPLMALLDDPHPIVSLASLRVATILTEDPVLIGALLRRLVGVRARRRDIVLEVLLSCGHKAPDALRGFAEKCTHAPLRPPALQALGILRDLDAVPLLESSLSSADHEEVAAAIEALATLGDPGATGPLERLFAHAEAGLAQKARRAVARLAC